MGKIGVERSWSSKGRIFRAVNIVNLMLIGVSESRGAKYVFFFETVKLSRVVEGGKDSLRIWKIGTKRLLKYGRRSF